MVMSYILAGMFAISAVFALLTGSAQEASAAAITGAGDAVALVISITGAICFWSGVMEVMEQSGLAGGLSRILRPIIKFLFPGAKNDDAAGKAIAENMSANLLGLGNAATPAGLRAAQRLKGRDLAMLIVINSASMQLLPTTIAAIRQSAGAANGFDIIIPVWIASICSVTAGVIAVRLLYRKDG
ncbi:MAG: spore maturation protein A [Oscillospiraceae bacterium]|nr:spore maturation protein A [Oscillospiraceae bacterium]